MTEEKEVNQHIYEEIKVDDPIADQLIDEEIKFDQLVADHLINDEVEVDKPVADHLLDDEVEVDQPVADHLIDDEVEVESSKSKVLKKCSMWRSMFETKSALIEHMNIIHNNKNLIHYEKHCDNVFTSKKNMLRHLDCSLNVVKCEQCGVEVHGTSGEKKHMIRKHSEHVKELNCEECGRMFVCEKSIKEHMKQHYYWVRCREHKHFPRNISHFCYRSTNIKERTNNVS